VLIASGHFPVVSGYKLSVRSSSLTIKLNIMSRTIKKAKKVVSKSCRNNGGCPVCTSNRLHKHNKKLEAILKEVKELHNKVFMDLVIYGEASYSLNTNNK